MTTSTKKSKARTGSVDSHAETAPSFELRFQPTVALIRLVRGFVSDFCFNVVDDPHVANRLALATHELLENVTKYSTDGAVVLRVAIDRENGILEVSTSNRATPERRAILRERFDEITAAADARSLYAATLKRSAVTRGRSGGLGLARIWAESEMAIHLVEDGELVEIHARGSIAAPS